MKTPRNHRHIPMLTPEQLQAALEQLQAAQNVSPRGLEHMRAMITAASDPASQEPENLVKTLPPERQTNIKAIADTYSESTKALAKRGRAGLEKISAKEWEQLIEDAANGES